MPTTHGSPISGTIARVSTRPVSRGCETRIIIGKTVTTEFARLVPGWGDTQWARARSNAGWIVEWFGRGRRVPSWFPLALTTQSGGSVVRPASLLRDLELGRF
jgi:hypothetical protein